MEKITTKEILGATGGKLLDGSIDTVFTNISTDTRNLKKGDLFIALKGKKFDAHEFVGEAIDNGVAGVIASSKVKLQIANCKSQNVVIIKVKDTLRAMQDIAAFYKKRFKIPFIAVTGSNGKTTTKEIIWSILSEKYKVFKSPGNFNNQIGVPLNIFRLDRTYKAAVLEFGTNLPGEIKRLAEVALPDIAVITNIGMSHTEGLKDLAGVAKEKFSLLGSLAKGKIVVLNSDDEIINKRIVKEKKRGYVKVISYGIKRKSDIYASGIEGVCERGMRFTLNMKGRKAVKIKLPLAGEHNLYNALAAVSSAYALGISSGIIKKGIEAMEAVSMRTDICRINGIKIINDCYNANPSSMKAAIKTMGSLKAERRIVVMGDMRELGRFAVSEHKNMAKEMAENNVDIFYASGKLAGISAKVFRSEGGKAFSFADNKKLIKALLKEIKSGDVILIKGSRAAGLEEVANVISKLKSQSSKLKD